MKALILAAGFGTRLQPHSKKVPKPLFHMNGGPILDAHIHKLVQAGCKEIIINTHHLHGQIKAHIEKNTYPIKVQTANESIILGTGGAIKNVESFLGSQPFMVINSDIITSIDLSAVFDFHCSNPYPVTMVLHDLKKFHAVRVDKKDFIHGFFSLSEKVPEDADLKNLAFTGIHVINSEIFPHIPKGKFSSIIDIYRSILKHGLKIKAYVSKNHYWMDMGTPQSYRQAVMDQIVPDAFKNAFKGEKKAPFKEQKLQGDGSDRGWYRLTSKGQSLVMSDHGICVTPHPEYDSFLAIHRHLSEKKIPVPRIYKKEPFAGLIIMEDLGVLDLQSFVQQSSPDLSTTFEMYRKTIDALIHFNQNGIIGFKPEWTYQTTHYNRQVILEGECRYFINAFLKGYLGITARFEDLLNEFEYLAENIKTFGITGLIHRDAQSKNVMIKDQHPCFIDFQGARIGPVQYDVASLLIDPYVALSDSLQEALFSYYSDRIMEQFPHETREKIKKGYDFCVVSRNLQMLGAFGFLSRVKKKKHFETYIPLACKRLLKNLNRCDSNSFPKLIKVATECKNKTASKT